MCDWALHVYTIIVVYHNYTVSALLLFVLHMHVLTVILHMHTLYSHDCYILHILLRFTQ